MPRYRITVGYDGTDFVGWQLQDCGVSIQGLIEQALFPFEGRRIVVTGASRTDAGVHASGQVAAFTLEHAVDSAAVVRALNARLPPAVRVLDAVETTAAFHPRFEAIAKTYRYTIATAPVVTPFEYRYVWHLPGPLDVDSMDAAAARLVGRRDFAAFQTSGTEVESTERELFESRVERGPDGAGHARDAAPASRPTVEYIVRGDGFLRHMVRAIVGSLVEIGKRRQPADWLERVLESRDRAIAGRNAPPQGLCLARVDYESSTG